MQQTQVVKKLVQKENDRVKQLGGTPRFGVGSLVSRRGGAGSEMASPARTGNAKAEIAGSYADWKRQTSAEGAASSARNLGAKKHGQVVKITTVLDGRASGKPERKGRYTGQRSSPKAIDCNR